MDKITGAEKKVIAEQSGIKATYCTTIFTGGVYHSSVTQARIGEGTLDRLVQCLPDALGYENWDAFYEGERKQMKDQALVLELPDKDYADITNDHHKKRIRDEIERRAKELIQEMTCSPTETSIEEEKPITAANGATSKEDQAPLPAKPLKELPKKDKRRSYVKWGGAALCLFSLIVLIYYFSGQGENVEQSPRHGFTKADEAAIIQTVYRSIDLEMAAYKHADLYEQYEDSLRQVFHPEVMAKIMDVLKWAVEVEYTLRNEDNPSNERAISVVIDSIDDSGVAHVKTHEYWLIMWYSMHARQYESIYSLANKQTYTLKRDALGVWKILTNDYGGNSPKSYIRAYTYNELSDQVEVPLSLFRGSVLKDIRMGNIEKSIAMIRFRIKHEKKGTILTESQAYITILQIEADFRIAQRKLNLKQETSKTFEASKADAIRRICKLLTELEKNN